MLELLSEDVDRRELQLAARETELYRREARVNRDTKERSRALESRELQLNRRETALATLAGELAAERERLTAVRSDLVRELRRLERRRVQASPGWFAAPTMEQNAQEEGWWAKVLGREAPAA